MGLCYGARTISYVSGLNRKRSVNTVKELHQKMIEITDSPTVYTTK